MTTKSNKSGLSRLKSDLNDQTFSTLYLLYGEETYLREFYLGELRRKAIDPSFADFNLIQLEGKGLTPDALTDAVESCPVMAEKKLVIVSDFDLYKPPAAFQTLIPEMLGDLPPYVILVFYFDILPFKPDKRTKIHGLLEKNACFAECAHMDDRELSAWIQRRFRALGKGIAPDACAYLIFLCGNSMTNLVTEIEKAAAHCTLDEVKRYNIDAVCTRTLDAVIFDLTDAITEKKFDRAIQVVGDLLAQKNSEVQIFSAVLRHMERLYAAKLHEESKRASRELLELLGTRSTYYAQRISGAARKVSLQWLRCSMLLCAETDAALKSSAADKKKIIEFALLQLASTMEV